MSCDYRALANAGVQKISPYEPGKPIETLERELGISNSIKLASNENPLGPSPQALKAITGMLPELALYPDGGGFALREAIAAKLRVSADIVTLGNGSNDVLELIARAYLAPGCSAVFSEHAFAVYPLAVMATGATPRIAKANPADHAMPYGHDLKALREAIDAHTRLVFIANPNNPTGTWLTRQALTAFLDSVPEDVLVVLDEAYSEYVGHDDYPDAIAWLQQYPNLIVTRTFSKIYGLAGLRIGFALSHPQVADMLNRVRQPFNTNMLAQAAAIASLGDADHILRSVALNDEGLAFLTQACTERGLRCIPSVGNFLCIEVGDGAKVYQELLREGVIVRPIASYGLPQYLRVSIGTAEDNQRFIKALDKVQSR